MYGWTTFRDSLSSLSQTQQRYRSTMSGASSSTPLCRTSSTTPITSTQGMLENWRILLPTAAEAEPHDSRAKFRHGPRRSICRYAPVPALDKSELKRSGVEENEPLGHGRKPMIHFRLIEVLA
jgi:hypothetical protein